MAGSKRPAGKRPLSAEPTRERLPRAAKRPALAEPEDAPPAKKQTKKATASKTATKENAPAKSRKKTTKVSEPDESEDDHHEVKSTRARTRSQTPHAPQEIKTEDGVEVDGGVPTGPEDADVDHTKGQEKAAKKAKGKTAQAATRSKKAPKAKAAAKPRQTRGKKEEKSADEVTREPALEESAAAEGRSSHSASPPNTKRKALIDDLAEGEGQRQPKKVRFADAEEAIATPAGAPSPVEEAATNEPAADTANIAEEASADISADDDDNTSEEVSDDVAVEAPEDNKPEFFELFCGPEEVNFTIPAIHMLSSGVARRQTSLDPGNSNIILPLASPASVQDYIEYKSRSSYGIIDPHDQSWTPSRLTNLYLLAVLLDDVSLRDTVLTTLVLVNKLINNNAEDTREWEISPATVKHIFSITTTDHAARGYWVDVLSRYPNIEEIVEQTGTGVWGDEFISALNKARHGRTAGVVFNARHEPLKTSQVAWKPAYEGTVREICIDYHDHDKYGMPCAHRINLKRKNECDMPPEKDDITFFFLLPDKVNGDDDVEMTEDEDEDDIHYNIPLQLPLAQRLGIHSHACTEACSDGESSASSSNGSENGGDDDEEL
ncbi:hypothetical protein K490DRAFT_59951 [Saccharata proteae CBS 121410]|uniref:Uncharacterized protein n=1 Tax=Saccharata proteae CBS 121410 TaxID=1314787 RepID=A0A9P4HLZ4_9PEZI|nr:hypothetical protein K490DRAFT_59951 [Saccharata proteae CBS 121410]